jgi:acetyl-CoA carboxylase biotin carboxyl carrier protein
MADTINAPMRGTILELLVAAGDKVSVGTEVAIIESMKMEIPVEAADAGTVASVLVETGQAVEEGDPLLELS